MHLLHHDWRWHEGDAPTRSRHVPPFVQTTGGSTAPPARLRCRKLRCTQTSSDELVSRLAQTRAVFGHPFAGVKELAALPPRPTHYLHPSLRCVVGLRAREVVKATGAVNVIHQERLAWALHFQSVGGRLHIFDRSTASEGSVLEHTCCAFSRRARRYAGAPRGRRTCPWARDEISDTKGFPANTNTCFCDLLGVLGANKQRPQRDARATCERQKRSGRA